MNSLYIYVLGCLLTVNIAVLLPYWSQMVAGEIRRPVVPPLAAHVLSNYASSPLSPRVRARERAREVRSLRDISEKDR